jgi:phosphoesterase RecJ-like protein
MSEASQKIANIISSAHKFVILQADNPDADSLGSALALEQILGDLGKEPLLYCATDMPGYLKYLAGWDRVSNELPTQFDASIIVDSSTMTLFEKLAGSGHQGWLASKPCIVLDHHEEVTNQIPFATVTINDLESSATGELIYEIARDLGWPLSIKSQEFLMTAILGDTQGLSNAQTKAQTYRIIADMIEASVDRAELEERRRELSKMTIDIFKYKARLLERTEFFSDNRIAIVSVPNSEITEFSPQYNPKLLVQYEMLQTVDVQMSIVFKTYDSGRVTAAIRCNAGAPIANKLAEHFGGGGHAYAAGFKVQDGRSFDGIKTETIRAGSELLDTLENNETL